MTRRRRRVHRLARAARPARGLPRGPARRRRARSRAREHPRRQRGARDLAGRARERVDSSPRASPATRTRSPRRRARATCWCSTRTASLRPGAVQRLVSFADEHPRAGVVGPRLLEPDGTLQRSRRRFPTVAGTLVRRTPLRLLREISRLRSPITISPMCPTSPVQCDWMLGACLLVRRAMLEEIGGFDEGFPMYGEDIELQYRAMRAGWERWYVPDAVAVHEYQRVIDRSAARPPHAVAPAGHGPLPPAAPGVARPPLVAPGLDPVR